MSMLRHVRAARRGRRGAVGFVAVCMAVVLSATSAGAATPSSLNGERFQGAELLFGYAGYPVDGTQPEGCNPNGTSIIEFTETGVATGPYPGVFTEHVVIHIGPQAPQGGDIQPGVLEGEITKFEATFEIDSLVGQVRGKKTLAPKRTPTDYITNTGSCFSVNAPDGSDFGYPWLDDFTFAARSANAFLHYEATIETADGTYHDSGDAWARFDEGTFHGYCNDVTNSTCQFIHTWDPTGEFQNFFHTQGGFQEFFFNSRGVTEDRDDEPATLELDPAAATNDVGTEHCVTATVRNAGGEPLGGVEVEFTVEGSTSTSGSVTTGNDGAAEFCYDGPELPGQDVITAFADSDDDGVQDEGEPGSTATKTWVFPTSTPNCDITINDGGWIIASNGDRGSFGGNAKVDALGKETGEQQYVGHGPADPMIFHSIEIAAVMCSTNRAEIYGLAEVDGVPGFTFRIRVTDSGEPSVADTYGILISNGYDSGDQPLQGGNIQIR